MTFIDCSIDPKKLHVLGSGAYSDVFNIDDVPDKVLRLSYYDEDILASVDRHTALAEQAIKEGHPRRAKVHMDLSKRAIDKDPITVESKLVRITNVLMERKICPHYVRVYASFECDGFYDILKKHGKIPVSRMTSMKRHPLRQKHNSISIVKRYSSDITQFIQSEDVRNGNARFRDMKRQDAVLAIILFQVLYALGTLQKYIHRFRHNDLSTNNVLINIDNDVIRSVRPGGYTVYKVNRKHVFKVPNTGVDVAMADFDFASGGMIKLKGFEKETPLRNIKVREGGWANTNEWHINPKRNKSYDVQYFLNGMLKIIRGVYPRADQLPLTKGFLKRVLDKTNGRNRSGSTFRALYPFHLILDPYFDFLRKEKPQGPETGRYQV
jgi:serine/threonine protein kinase